MVVVSVAEARGLTMRFGTHTAIDGLDVEVGRGVTGVVGANGAGKTTLFSLMLGRLRPSAGQVTVLGLDPRREGSTLRAKVGFSPERNVLPDEMPAYEFVRHLAEVRGLPRTEARSRASDALWLMGLGEERFRPLGTMSTGQRQRVKVAQAIAADPALVLLDEPTDGLDPVQREQMLGLIRTIADRFGIDVLISSHVLGEVERIADNVVVLDAGHLLAAGSLTELAGDDIGVEVEIVEGPGDLGVTDRVATTLRAGGLSVERGAVALLVTGDDAQDRTLDAVRDAVAAHGARLRRLETRRRNLEELLLDGEPE
jgi:ABC-2 type transport system ATP-binding protein